MSKFNFNEKDLKENGWEVLPDGFWFGFDLADSHKANIPTMLSELIGFDSDAEGYSFGSQKKHYSIRVTPVSGKTIYQ